MIEPYYNLSYGTGMEGFINYANLLVDGWLVNAFLFVIFLISTYVLSKSEWEMSTILSFSFLLCLISSMIFRLFTDVSELLIFIIIIGLGVSILWGIISRR